MAATFSFGFAGNDIDNDDTAEGDGAPKAHESATIHTISLPTKRHSLERSGKHCGHVNLVFYQRIQLSAFSAMTTGNDHVFWQSVADVQLHEIIVLLPITAPDTLLRSRYCPHTSPTTILIFPLLSNDVCRSFSARFGQKPPPKNARAFTLPRRSLHDIRTQLMAESTLGENGDEELISGLDTGDLSSGSYEGRLQDLGGGAIDLAAFVAKNVTLTEDQAWHVIELGAGSGIPSLAILRDALSTTGQGHKSVKFTFCDYNEEVLKLVTMPNVLLSWWEFCAKQDGVSTQKNPSGEAGLDDIDENMSHRFMTDCTIKRVSFEFISGAWGPSFVDLIRRSPHV